MTDERGSNETKSAPDRKDAETPKQELSDQDLAAIAAGRAMRHASEKDPVLREPEFRSPK